MTITLIDFETRDHLSSPRYDYSFFFQDKGCNLHPKCIECPRVICQYDDVPNPNQERHVLREKRDKERTEFFLACTIPSAYQNIQVPVIVKVAPGHTALFKPPVGPVHINLNRIEFNKRLRGGGI